MNGPRNSKINPPSFLNMRDIFLQAVQELAIPYPSVQLNNWGNFNRMVGGFRTKEFSILCGPTGVGKTAWLASLSAQLVRQNEKHFVASVETGPTNYMKSVLSNFCGRDLNTGDAVAADELARISVENLPLIESGAIEFALYEDRLSDAQLMSDIKFHVDNGCKIAIIDNLNFLMEVTRASEQLVEMDRVIHNLIIFCKKNAVHIIMVMHPKKTDGGRVESEFDIKGSSTAVQEAQNVFLLNRPRIDDIKAGERNWGQRELKLAKMRRRGRWVGFSVLYEMTNFARYEEVSSVERRFT